jgi:peptidoglycan/xylan/chitin deacetylase (PgdA/CDA1 family)
VSAPRRTADHAATPSRRLGAVLLAVLTTLAVVAGVLAWAASSPAPGATRPLTVVSLTFDDGNADQAQAAAILQEQGLRGTFYVPSGFVGAPGYLTLAQVKGLQTAGHEVGGHTINHPDLTTVSAAEKSRQVCGDRAWLLAQGLQVRSFAYPFASLDAATKQVVADCGYNSARGLGDLRTGRPGDECAGCPRAETVPPADAFETRAPSQVESDWRLADLQRVVTNAEQTGGWTQLTFHHVCASGCEINVTPTVLRQFAAWLKPRAATRNTVVRTVGDVVGGAVKPAVQPTTNPPLEPGVNGVVNPGMEQLDASGDPTCWMRGGYGTNTATLDTSAGRTGQRGGRVTVSGYADGDAKWLPRFDLGDCTPTVAAGHAYSLRSWYRSSAVTQFAVYLRDEVGTWRYWTSSPWFAAASSWTAAEWTTPELPAGSTGISFGLNLFSNGTLETDDVAVYDAVGAPSAQGTSARTPADAPSLTGAPEPPPGDLGAG